MKVAIFRIFSLVMLILCMITIFGFSAEEADVSTETSAVIVQKVAQIIYPDFNDLDQEEQEKIIDELQFAVRKTAHFCIYGLLGIFAFLTLITYTKIKLKTRYILSLLICLLYAASDEWHQYYVPDRSCELRDVLIDFSGAFLGVTAVLLFVAIIRPIYKSISYRGDKKLRKKQLIEQNSALFGKLDMANAEISELKKEISTLKKEIAALIPQDEPQINEPVNTESVKKAEHTEEVKSEKIELSEDIEYGSSVIGKIVVEAAKNCNILSARQNEQARELVNLVLGKTEVAKSEILGIVSSEKELSEKKRLIDTQYAAACEYFIGILGQ